MSQRAGSDEDIEIPGGTPSGLRSAAALHDPFDWYERRRQRGPVVYDDDRGVYDAFSYDAVREGLRDSDRLVRKELSGGTGTPFSYIGEGMVWSDGDEHRRIKRQLFEYFRPDLLEGMQERIREVAETQLSVALEGGPAFDFVSEFAVPVPLRVVMDLVGVPAADHRRVLGWLETFREVMHSEYDASGTGDPDRMAEAVAYFEELVARRREDPEDDLLSQLAVGTELSGAEIGANCFDVVLAGQGTMSELLSNALYLFETRGVPDDHDLSVVVEEVLRYRAPLQARARETAEPVWLGGTEIPAGETVILWIGAANRDPERYDRAGEFLPGRDPDHLAFGSGPHTCIGAPLARLEAPVVLRTFLDGVEGFGINHGAAVPKAKPSKLGFDRLPVSTEP
jgi:cytochrome P450